jgi:hypothetical protein
MPKQGRMQPQSHSAECRASAALDDESAEMADGSRRNLRVLEQQLDISRVGHIPVCQSPAIRRLHDADACAFAIMS